MSRSRQVVAAVAPEKTLPRRRWVLGIRKAIYPLHYRCDHEFWVAPLEQSYGEFSRSEQRQQWMARALQQLIAASERSDDEWSVLQAVHRDAERRQNGTVPCI